VLRTFEGWGTLLRVHSGRIAGFYLLFPLAALALLSNNSVKCWGWAFGGSLGAGSQTIIGDDELPSMSGPAALF
jgi:hypothetical protein